MAYQTDIEYDFSDGDDYDDGGDNRTQRRDGIIKSFQLAETDFRVKPKEEKTSGRDTEVMYSAVALNAAGRERCLGYIRFKGRDGEGTVDLVNCAATLKPQHLLMGGSSKAGDVDQAGGFGEGLKVALVVMLRGAQNHHVQCRSGGFTWKFTFDKYGELVAYLRRMAPDHMTRTVDQAERQAKRTKSLLPFVPQPGVDVHFVIGGRYRGYNEAGNEKISRSTVKRTEFDAWTKAALFLQHGAGENTIIETAYGDLLTAVQFQGAIYLKGLLLVESTAERSASKSSLPLRYSYNFASGKTDRERKAVSSADGEFRAIMAIWDIVLAVRPDMVAALSDMLNSTEPKYADVAGAPHYVTKSMARFLKEHLCGGEHANNWYYTDDEKNRNPRLDHIIRDLGRTGAKLTQTYWDALSKYNLVRTAEDEENLLFAAAPRTAVPDTAFASRLCRLLSACLRGCPQTDDLSFGFVHAGQLNLQMSFSDDNSAFRIHDRWLSIEGAIAELRLRGTLAEARILYHTVKRLFSDALDQLPLELFVADSEEQLANTVPESRKILAASLAEERLLDFLRIDNPTVEPVAGQPALRVTWPVDPQWDAGTEAEIQCHRASTCHYLRDHLQIADQARANRMGCIAPEITGDGGHGDHGNGEYTCRATRLHSSQGQHVERDLDVGEAYFFLLVMTPTDPGSLVSFSSADHRCETRSSMSPVLGDEADDAYNDAYDDTMEDNGGTAGTTAGTTAGPSNSSRYRNPRRSAPTRNEREVVVIDIGENEGDDQDEIGRGRALSEVATAEGEEYLSLGPQLKELDVLSIRRWHAAKSSGNITDNIVIGIRVEDKEKTTRTRRLEIRKKRQRME